MGRKNFRLQVFRGTLLAIALVLGPLASTHAASGHPTFDSSYEKDVQEFRKSMPQLLTRQQMVELMGELKDSIKNLVQLAAGVGKSENITSKIFPAADEVQNHPYSLRDLQVLYSLAAAVQAGIPGNAPTADVKRFLTQLARLNGHIVSVGMTKEAILEHFYKQLNPKNR